MWAPCAAGGGGGGGGGHTRAGWAVLGDEQSAVEQIDVLVVPLHLLSVVLESLQQPPAHRSAQPVGAVSTGRR